MMRATTTLFAILVLTSAARAPSMSAAVFVVRPDGTGDFDTIRAAVDASTNGDTVLLADGTFTGPDNRDINCTSKAITIASSSGNPRACVIDCSHLGRAFAFLCVTGSGFVLKDVTISNGQGNNGGGIYCCRAGITLDNVVFTECQALLGGAVAFIDAVAPRVVNCTFLKNSAVAHADYAAIGGALYFSGSSPVASGCRFVDNASEHDGGAIGCSGVTGAEVQDCEFLNNRAHWGGGMSAKYADIRVTDCVFEGNSAWNGGGILVVQHSASITRCRFKDNICEVGGGGICIGPSEAEIVDCTMIGNASASGGAAVDKYMEGRLSIRGSTICGSSGGLEWPGGAICATVSTLGIENSIVAFGSSGPAVTCVWSSVDVACCDLYGNAGGDWVGCVANQESGFGNIHLNPEFCDAASGDLTVRADSPCAAKNSPECGQIGSEPVGCDIPIATSPTTWGRIKHRYHP